MNDNFFELGGHSLLIMRIASEVRKVLEIDVPILHFFDSPTIAGLAVVTEEILVRNVENSTEQEV